MATMPAVPSDPHTVPTPSSPANAAPVLEPEPEQVPDACEAAAAKLAAAADGDADVPVAGIQRSGSSFNGVPEEAELDVAAETTEVDADGQMHTPSATRQRQSSVSSRSSVEREAFDELPDVPDNLLDMSDGELEDVDDLDDEDKGQYETTAAPFAAEEKATEEKAEAATESGRPSLLAEEVAAEVTKEAVAEAAETAEAADAAAAATAEDGEGETPVA